MAITAVPSQATGSIFNSPTTTIGFPGNVTNGNNIICSLATFYTSGNPHPIVITKSSGTGNIGTQIIDAYFSPDSNDDLYIIRIPVTNTGTLVLFVSSSVNDYNYIGINEYSGMATSPVDGLQVAISASGTQETSSNVVLSAGGGMITQVTVEAFNIGSRSSISDTIIYQSDDAINNEPGLNQYKLANAGTYVLGDILTNSGEWASLAIAYKADAGGVTSAPVYTAQWGNAKLGNYRVG